MPGPSRKKLPSPPDSIAFGLTPERCEQDRIDKLRASELDAQAFRLGCLTLFVLLPLGVVSAVFVAYQFKGANEESPLLERVVGIAVAMVVVIWGGLIVRALAREARKLRQPMPEKAAFDAALKRFRESSRDFWTNLDPYRFEWRVAELLHQLDPSIPACPTEASSDGGIDIWIPAAEDAEARNRAFGRHPLPSPGVVLVQCKRYSNPCGPEAVRSLLGVMIHESAGGGLLVALGGFTKGARQFAEGKPISLWTVEEILELQETAHESELKQRGRDANREALREDDQKGRRSTPLLNRDRRETLYAMCVFLALIAVFAVLIRWAFPP